MEKETLSNQQLLDTLLQAFGLRASDMARCLQVDKSALAKWAKLRGGINSKASLRLSYLWVQTRSILKTNQPPSSDFAAADQALLTAHQTSRLQAALQRLERQQAALVKMHSDYHALQLQVQRLEALDVSLPPFDKGQQLQVELWILERKQALSLIGALTQYDQAMRIAQTEWEIDRLKKDLDPM